MIVNLLWMKTVIIQSKIVILRVRNIFLKVSQHKDYVIDEPLKLCS